MMKDVSEKNKYKIGCSGFHYEEWKDKFYPEGLPKTKWFQYYNGIFNTVELNVTFYRTMKQSFFENLYQRSGPDFRFSVKASRIITHYKKFNNLGPALTEFYSTVVGGLKDKLGCILFQMPPSYTYKKEYLTKIVDQLDPGFKNVVEFRHESWWNKEVYDTLQQNKICFCTVSYPGLPEQLVSNGPLIYARLHGVPVLYHSAYSEKYLQSLSENLKLAHQINEVYIYFDNTDNRAAIKNANTLKQMLGLL
jgi:uncharacterized protein YecE (DUF72 family)